MIKNPIKSMESNNCCASNTFIQSIVHPISNMPLFKLATPMGSLKNLNNLEYCGSLNMLEWNGWIKVELLLFAHVLLITQKSPNGLHTVIKDPIYTTKISYLNIPPYALSKLNFKYIKFLIFIPSKSNCLRII